MILGVDSIPYFNVNQPLELSIEGMIKNGGLLYQIYGLALAVKIMLMVTREKFLFVGLKNIISQKVQIEQFKDSPDHLHPIEDSEKLKCSEVVRELVMQEAELRQKEVTNIKYKVCGPLDTHLVGDPKRELDI
ncbi:hypothetical protein RhiirC2_800855 [Rhizophagus irregularis]|uniref:Uncharacterized protein n=1 Tax=Rhizophagus irregularis TaxID=588596 RepID=A0A2N1M351_9GLOM|nr:hypothetical protein RhiirC2_800855 [Rhizophagus irregularis]